MIKIATETHSVALRKKFLGKYSAVKWKLYRSSIVLDADPKFILLKKQILMLSISVLR